MFYKASQMVLMKGVNILVLFVLAAVMGEGASHCFLHIDTLRFAQIFMGKMHVASLSS